MTDNGEDAALDRRVRRTRAAIQSALVALIVEKGYDAVTVSDIIQRADIGRSTFYAHFTDKHDLFTDMMDDLTGFLGAPNGSPTQPLFAFSLPMFQHIEQERSVIDALFGQGGSTVAQESTRRMLTEHTRAELRARTTDRQLAISIEVMADVVVSSFLCVAAHGFTSTSTTSAMELDRIFRALVIPGIAATVGYVHE